jgi:hypothetical protein
VSIISKPESYQIQPIDIFPGTVAPRFANAQQGVAAYWAIVYLQESKLTWLPLSITDIEQLPVQFEALVTAGFLVQQNDQRYYFTEEFVKCCAGKA